MIASAAEFAAAVAGLTWGPLRPGVDVHWLYRDGRTGGAAALLRYAPGAHVPAHRHAGPEHVLVLAGAQEDERGRYPAGALTTNAPGSVHRVSSPDGCLVLIVWQRPVEFLAGG